MGRKFESCTRPKFFENFDLCRSNDYLCISGIDFKKEILLEVNQFRKNEKFAKIGKFSEKKLKRKSRDFFENFCE